MRKSIALCVVFAVAFSAMAQTLEGLDFIAPFNDGVAAVKKGDQWTFIDDSGKLIFPFRNDLAISVVDNKKYPVFENDRCLIAEKKEGITYFGYVNKEGVVVVQPQFLNATNFQDQGAIVLLLEKKENGKNIIGKSIYSHIYSHVVINAEGTIVKYLDDPRHITLSDKFIANPPKITARFVSNDVVTYKTADKKWAIKKIDSW